MIFLRFDDIMQAQILELTIDNIIWLVVISIPLQFIKSTKPFEEGL